MPKMRAIARLRISVFKSSKARFRISLEVVFSIQNTPPQKGVSLSGDSSVDKAKGLRKKYTELKAMARAKEAKELNGV